MSQNNKQPKTVGNFVVGRVLGTGCFSKVRLATDQRNGVNYAMKIIDKALLARDHLEDQVRREISILKVLRHKYVVQMREAFQTSRSMYVVMELVEGGELFDVVADQGRLSEDLARKYFQQLIVAVRYCHANKIAHRDLKLENLLLDIKGNLKVSDFGLANMQATPDASVLRTVCGTPNYVAPEVIKMNNRGGAGSGSGGENRASGYNGFTADIWSCGIILFIMLSGRQAFDDDDLKALFNKIERGQYQMSRHIPEGAKSLIERMLTVDPAQRITIDGIIKHPWFQVGFDPNELTCGTVPSLPDDDAVQNAVTNVPDSGAISPQASPMRGSTTLSGLQINGSGSTDGGANNNNNNNNNNPFREKSLSPQNPQLGGSPGNNVPLKLIPVGLDGFQLANALIATALNSSPFVDLGSGMLSSAGVSSPSKARAASLSGSGSPGTPGGLNNSMTPGGSSASSTTSQFAAFGNVRQFMIAGPAPHVHAVTSEWLKSVLPSALRGPGTANAGGGGGVGGSSVSGAGGMAELRGFMTTPRGIMTFVMEVFPTSAQNVCLVQARKSMGDNFDFLETIKGYAKKMRESQLLLSELRSPPEAIALNGSFGAAGGGNNAAGSPLSSQSSPKAPNGGGSLSPGSVGSGNTASLNAHGGAVVGGLGNSSLPVITSQRKVAK